MSTYKTNKPTSEKSRRGLRRSLLTCLLAPPAEQAMLLAAVVANLGGMVLEKNEEADPDNPRRSSHGGLAAAPRRTHDGARVTRPKADLTRLRSPSGESRD